MLRNLRSFYGKIIIFLIVFCTFILYVKMMYSAQNLEKMRDGSFQKPAAAKFKVNPRLIKQPNLPKDFYDVEDNEVLSPVDEQVAEQPILNTVPSPFEDQIKRDLAKQQPGLGNDGKAVRLSGEAKLRGEEIYKKIALNEELSEILSYNRTVPDARNPLCRSVSYDISVLPTASIVIIFFNEPYSVLVRTVHSVLNTCDKSVLKEIILVDDASENEELHGKLDHYVNTRLDRNVVKVLRLKNRLGLIRARLAGARMATGDVLIFLDAHCEAVTGWIEPLLDRIRESPSSVLVPIIDVIDSNDFQYSTNGFTSFQVGGFTWNGHFDWIDVSKREKQRKEKECDHPEEICPTNSPTMAGGLFAIDRKYFWEIGSYDEQMDGWGGENLEMSFRIWQCGGTIETIPCSRVGHVFRDFHPYKFPNDKDTHGINTARMANVWMDEYKELFYIFRPDLRFHPDVGDVTHRMMLKKKLKCKSFDWFLNNVYPEKFKMTKGVVGWGKFKTVQDNLCFDDLQQNNEKPFNLGLYYCSQTLTHSQFFAYTKQGELRNELACATVQRSDSPPYLVVMVQCYTNSKHNEHWVYLPEHKQFLHKSTRLCLDHRGLKAQDYLQVAPCDIYSDTQKWEFKNSTQSRLI